MGAFPAIIFVIGILFVVCLIPYLFYEKYQRDREKRESMRKTNEMLGEMFKLKWDKTTLTYQDECCICLGEF